MAMFTTKNEIDSTVVISNERFTELVRKEEQFAVIERLLNANKFMTVEDIKTVLGIEERESTADEQ